MNHLTHLAYLLTSIGDATDAGQDQNVLCLDVAMAYAICGEVDCPHDGRELQFVRKTR